MSSKNYQAAVAKGYIAKAKNVERKYGIPDGYLVGLLEQESAWRPDVIHGKTKSSAGALGIAQFMPKTAAEVGVDPLDPFAAIEASGKYLKRMYKSTNSWKLAMRSYNWGIGNVKRYASGDRKDMPKEARDYPGSVMRRARKHGTGFVDEGERTEVTDSRNLMPSTESVDFRDEQTANISNVGGGEQYGSATSLDMEVAELMPKPVHEEKFIDTPQGRMKVVPETPEEESLIAGLGAQNQNELLMQMPELIAARDNIQSKALFPSMGDDVDRLLGEIIDGV